MEFDDVVEIRFMLRNYVHASQERFETLAVGRNWQSYTVKAITVVLPPERAPLIKLHMKDDNTVIIPDAEVSYFVQI